MTVELKVKLRRAKTKPKPTADHSLHTFTVYFYMRVYFSPSSDCHAFDEGYVMNISSVIVPETVDVDFSYASTRLHRLLH